MTGTSCASPSTTSRATPCIRRLLRAAGRVGAGADRPGRLRRAGADRLRRRHARARLRRRARLPQSKLAQIMSRFDLAEELDPASGVTATALHPATYMPTKMVIDAGVAPAHAARARRGRHLAPRRRPGGRRRQRRLLQPDASRTRAGRRRRYDADDRRALRELSQRLTGRLELRERAGGAAMPAHGSPRSASRSGHAGERPAARVQVGRRRAPPTPAAWPPARRAARARRRARRWSAPYVLRATSTSTRPPRFSLRQAVVRPCGWRSTSSSASSPARARTVSESCRRRSGATTCSPREPEVIAYGASPSSRSSVAEGERALADHVEVGVRVLVGRVEVEHEPVGLVRAVGAGRPRVRRHAVELGERDAHLRAADGVGDGAALAAARHLDAPDPVGHALRDLLLDHDGLVDARVPAPDVERALVHVRAHRGVDGGVVRGQVELGDPVGREQQLVRTADPDPAAPGPQGRVARRHPGKPIRTLHWQRRRRSCNNLFKPMQGSLKPPSEFDLPLSGTAIYGRPGRDRRQHVRRRPRPADRRDAAGARGRPADRPAAHARHVRHRASR